MYYKSYELKEYLLISDGKINDKFDNKLLKYIIKIYFNYKNGFPVISE